MPDDFLERSMDNLQESGQTTIIYFTGRLRNLGFDTYLYLGYSEQHLFATYDELCDHANAQLCGAEPLPVGNSADRPALKPSM